MNINSINNNSSFKGYDARKLKGFIMSGNCHNLAQEMQNIGRKEGFDVYSVFNDNFNRVIVSSKLPKSTRIMFEVWAQDFWTIYKNKLFASIDNCKTFMISEKFNLYRKYMETNKNDVVDISGGNLYFIQEDDYTDSLLVGVNEQNRFTKDDIKKRYDIDKVIFIPQMDFHLDLFIRPLDNKKILVTDDNKTLEVLNEILNRLLSLPKEQQTKEIKSSILSVKYQKGLFEQTLKKNNLSQTDEIVDILEKNGFTTIRVPGRLYSIIENLDKSILQHDFNYINANVLKNKDNELVYITNKSDIDNLLGLTPDIISKIGTSVEKSFIDSISPYIKNEHIYFVEGDNNFVAQLMLLGFRGGIHCACTEIPDDKDITNEGKKIEYGNNKKNRWWKFLFKKK